MVILKVFDCADRGETAILRAIVLLVGGVFALGFVVRSVDMAHGLYRGVLVGIISALHMYFHRNASLFDQTHRAHANECRRMGPKE